MFTRGQTGFPPGFTTTFYPAQQCYRIATTDRPYSVSNETFESKELALTAVLANKFTWMRKKGHGF